MNEDQPIPRLAADTLVAYAAAGDSTMPGSTVCVRCALEHAIPERAHGPRFAAVTAAAWVDGASRRYDCHCRYCDTRVRCTLRPVVGMGATEHLHSDRQPCTVVAVSPSGITITLQQDKATRTDANGFSEDQTYTYERNPEGRTVVARLCKDGRYHIGGRRGNTVALGYRQRYYDFCF